MRESWLNNVVRHRPPTRDLGLCCVQLSTFQTRSYFLTRTKPLDRLVTPTDALAHELMP